MSFSCPICSGPTEVAETRHNASGLRRRRLCVSIVCPGRITTQEVPVLGGRKQFDGRHVVIPRMLVDRLADPASDLTEMIEQHRTGYGEEQDGAW